MKEDLLNIAKEVVPCRSFRNRPVKVVYIQEFNDFKAAFDFETQIKKWSRQKKEALIAGEFDKLKILSKKKNFKGKRNVIPSNKSKSWDFGLCIEEPPALFS